MKEKNENGKAPKKPKGELSAVQNAIYARALQMKGKEAKRIPDDTTFINMYPNLWEWVTCYEISDAFQKEPAKLSFSIVDGYWSVTLADAALQQSLTALGGTFQEALQRLETSIVDKEAQWVHWKRRREALRWENDT